MKGVTVFIVVFALAGFGTGARADSVTVAVAANFANALHSLQASFEARGAHELVVVTGSTGQLYAQIVNGAPFDVFLAADAARPQMLIEQGLARSDARFTYALGRLVLWTREPSLADALSLETLARADYRWLAIANPALAPYGHAASQTLAALGLDHSLEPRLVRGQNVGQTFAMVDTRNAELGLVALAQVVAADTAGSYILIPETLHAPIRQDGVMLTRAANSPAASAFVDFLASAEARGLIGRFGYGLPN